MITAVFEASDGTPTTMAYVVFALPLTRSGQAFLLPGSFFPTASGFVSFVS